MISRHEEKNGGGVRKVQPGPWSGVRCEGEVEPMHHSTKFWSVVTSALWQSGLMRKTRNLVPSGASVRIRPTSRPHFFFGSPALTFDCYIFLPITKRCLHTLIRKDTFYMLAMGMSAIFLTVGDCVLCPV